MRVITLLLSVVFSFQIFAHRGHRASPATRSARFVSFEFHPDADQKLNIRSIKCDPAKNDLKVETYTSTKKTSNGEVNVLSVYARSGECSGSVSSSVWEEVVKIPKNGKYTHVNVTILSDNILVPLL